ncbi:MAG: DeoR/GlpR family DNA-binding transcription regulator [Phycisphaerales bacterium]
MNNNEHIPAAAPGLTPRHSQILQVINREGGCSVDDLALSLGVSTMTIRRDLQELADTGHVLRTHGGAVPAARVSFEFRFLKDAQQNAQAKEQIARLAAEQIRDGDSVLLDSSTTTLAIARHLRGRALTVITTSLPIASELYACNGIDLILLGGLLRNDSPDLAGPLTEANLENMRATVAFIGADGIDEAGMIYNKSTTVARMLQKMAGSAERVYAVADHSKVGKTALMRFGDISKWQGLITDSDLDTTWHKRFKKAGVCLIQPNNKP